MLADRRCFFTFIAGMLATPALARAQSMSRITAYAFSFAGLDGGDIRLADYAGKPILDRQHRLALRLHPAIYRPAAALDALPRSRV